MTNTILQIPMNKEVKARATQVASEYGLSSLQEAVRIYVHQLANKEIKIGVTEKPVIKLSKRAEKRYAKMDEDYKKHPERWLEAKNVDELMKMLNKK